LTGRLQQQQHPQDERKNSNIRAKLGGFRGLGGEKKRYKNI